MPCARRSLKRRVGLTRLCRVLALKPRTSRQGCEGSVSRAAEHTWAACSATSALVTIIVVICKARRTSALRARIDLLRAFRVFCPQTVIPCGKSLRQSSKGEEQESLLGRLQNPMNPGSVLCVCDLTTLTPCSTGWRAHAERGDTGTGLAAHATALF